MPPLPFPTGRFEESARLRPVDLVAFPQVELDDPGRHSSTPCPQPAPSAAAVADCDGPVRLGWRSGEMELAADCDGRSLRLSVVSPRGRSVHRSRRFGRAGARVRRLAVTLTGTQLTAFGDDGGGWIARGRVDLSHLGVPTRDPDWLAGLRVSHTGAAHHLRAGAFGALGLRDLRAVTEPDGSPYRPDGRILLSATSAGPGFFATAHASVWALDPVAGRLDQLSEITFRRDGRVYGDHALHLVHDPAAGWLVAASTWGGFTDRRRDRVSVTLATTSADLLAGRHVLDARPLALPTEGLDSVGVWDPHLVRDEETEEWLVGFVSARRYFDFHPALATGPSLDELRLRAAATDRRATEGTTLQRFAEGWRILASDGRDNPPDRRAQYPCFDLDFGQVGTLRSAYPSNLPWPTLVPVGEEWWHIAFDGTATGGELSGYGTHGAVVVSRCRGAAEPRTAGGRNLRPGQSREGAS
ncbi:MAG: hypothetical protein QM638_15525 [Nocardioides sp.]|uniref:hypothetical protein n=1 Tax=Nocardioides sp. TaxID=35761 RepID=UPI0039E44FAE